MATNTEVNVRINVDAKGANGSVGSIKKQLKEATNELLNMRDKFGDTSAEAVQAAKKVADLKDAIGDAKAMTDAFDPDAKFKAFGASLQGVAGGFSAVQGAQALFGAESEAVSKTLAKVQGAMALSQGINSILQARDSFKNLGAVLQNVTIIQKALNFVMTGSFKTQQSVTQAKQSDIATTTAQTTATTGLTLAQNAARIAAIALRGAIMATGIGALVIGVIALVSAIGDWISGADEAKAAMDEANKSMETQKELYDDNISRIEYEGKIRKLNAEIAGKSAKELAEIDKQTSEAKIKEAEKAAKESYKTYEKYYDSLGSKVSDEEAQLIQKLYDSHKEANKNLIELQRSYTEETLQEQKRRNDLRIAADAELLSLEQNNFLAGIKDADIRAKEKAKIDFLNSEKSLKEKGYAANQEQKILSELEKKKNLEIQAIDDAANQKRIDKANAAAKERKQKIDAANKEIIDAENNLNKQIEALNNELLLAEIKNEDERAKKKLEIQLKAQIKEVENSKANESLKLDAIMALKMKFDSDVQAIDDAAATKKAQSDAEKREKEIEFANETEQILQENRISRIQDTNQQAFESESLRFQNEVDALYQQLNTKEITEQQFKARREALEQTHQNNVTDIEKTASEERQKQSEAERQAKIAQFQEIGSLASELSNIIGQNTAVGKALALSQIAIDTGVAISALTRNSEQNPANAPTSGIAGAIQFASGLIRIIANIKKAKDLLSQAKVPAKGGISGGNTSVNIPTQAPLPPQLSTTMLNQGQINQLSSATARAFVLESDVSGNQERIQRLNRAARIN